MTKREPQVTVYKVGGSLFDMPDLFIHLKELLRDQSTRPLIVAGGGGAADVVREWDRIHGLGESRSHRLAILSLSLGTAFLADGLGGRVVSDRDEASAAWAAKQIPVLDVAKFLEREALEGATLLPASWEVTSDSIAAWVAERWPARLALVKSASSGRARDPYVDPYFAQASVNLDQVEWINLRDGERGHIHCAAVRASTDGALCEEAIL